MHEARAAARDLPQAAARFGALAVAGLAAADPARCAPAAYVETVLGAADLIAAAPAADPARRAIAGRLVELGLPSPALRVVAPALASGDRAARLVGARAQVALGRRRGGARHPRRAERAGRPRRCAPRPSRSPATTAGRWRCSTAAPAAGADALAWPAGAWARVQADAGAPESRAAMAAFMTAAATATTPSTDPGALAPGPAFSEPLPDLSRPSLDAARRLLAVGPKVGGLVAEALDDGG